MRFALLGTHPDGLALAHALCATGRHELVVCQGSEPPNFARSAKAHQDLEDVLADPAIELVIVAGSLTVRDAQLRRALQSEHDTLCVHPCAEKPDIAYEAALIQADTKRLLLPMLPDSLHPVFARLRELLGDEQSHFGGNGEPFRLLQVECWTVAGAEALMPAWDVLRRLGGEIVEV